MTANRRQSQRQKDIPRTASRRRLSLCAGALVSFAGCCFLNTPTFAAPAADPGTRPNIVFILTDDMGYGDLGCYGGKFASTPHIDRLAQEGIRLTQFYVAAPICSPSRTGLLTGMYPARWRITSYLQRSESVV